MILWYTTQLIDLTPKVFIVIKPKQILPINPSNTYMTDIVNKVVKNYKPHELWKK